MKKTIILILLFFGFASECCANERYGFLKQIQNEYADAIQKLTKNTVGYTAPVAGRSFNYFFLGLHESMVGLVNNLNSFSNKIDSYNRNVYLNKEDSLSPEIVFIHTADDLLRNLFFTMSKTDSIELLNLKQDLLNTIDLVDDYKFDKSVAYAKQFALEFINFSEKDGGKNGVLENYPTDYTIKKCDSCWVKTIPNFLPAEHPYWGENKKLILPDSIENNLKPMPFSTEEDSELFKESKVLFELQDKMSVEQEIIAKYWNDAPGFSGTPVGHFFSILQQNFTANELEFQQRSYWFAVLGMALNDAIVETWYLKYKHNYIRPITYIHRHISTKYNTKIPTPAFPEYPSGHSVQAGVANVVFDRVFPSANKIIDSTHIKRNDIVGKPRKYESFTELAEELSISRWYGGIHFKISLEESLAYGRKIGEMFFDKLN